MLVGHRADEKRKYSYLNASASPRKQEVGSKLTG